MDEQEQAELGKLVAECAKIAWDAWIKTLGYSAGEDRAAVGMLANTLLQHKLRTREVDSQSTSS